MADYARIVKLLMEFGPHLRMPVISAKASSNEWVILLRGNAVLRFENQSQLITMNPGDYIRIDKHVRHRVEWTNPAQETIWLAVHYS